MQSSEWCERVREEKVRKCNNTWVDKKYEHASRMIWRARKEKKSINKPQREGGVSSRMHRSSNSARPTLLELPVRGRV